MKIKFYARKHWEKAHFFKNLPWIVMFIALLFTGNLLAQPSIATSRHIGTTRGSTPLPVMVGNEVHILSTSSETAYPITNGTTLTGAAADLVYTKLNATTGE